MDGKGRNLVRVWAGVVLSLCAGLLWLGTSLTPEPEGIGTHRQMGLPSCSWIAAGRGPCPSCGMTTAFALAAHGRLIDSARVQPAAALLALVVAMAAWIALYTLITGCQEARRLRALLRPATFLIVAAIVMAAWGYKIVIG